MDFEKLVAARYSARKFADKAVEMEIGARGLRSVMESTMQNIMFTTPSDKSIRKVIVTKECVEGTAEPTVIRE